MIGRLWSIVKMVWSSQRTGENPVKLMTKLKIVVYNKTVKILKYIYLSMYI